MVTDAAKSNVPALGYNGAYAFANVILTLAGTLIMLVLVVEGIEIDYSCRL